MYDIKVYGNRVLRRKAQRVAGIDDGIRELVRDMLRTMYANQGAGLAAQQIGRTENLCVIDVRAPREDGGAPVDPEHPDLPMPLVMVNPEIQEREGACTAQEGCLSFPEIYVNITRAERVTVAFEDLEGVSRVAEVSGLLARAVQHELDHLNGVLIVDRMTSVQKVAVGGKLKRLKKIGQA